MGGQEAVACCGDQGGFPDTTALVILSREIQTPPTHHSRGQGWG